MIYKGKKYFGWDSNNARDSTLDEDGEEKWIFTKA